MRFMRSSRNRDGLPDLAEIDATWKRLRGRVARTPLMDLTGSRLEPDLPEGARVWMKLELFQKAGSFKARGVTLAVAALPDGAEVIAASGGNHALAVARAAGSRAHLIMPEAADPGTVAECEALGAAIERTPGTKTDLALLTARAEETGRVPLHPFESRHMILGAATCGYEIVNTQPELDAVIVPVGGGGLIAGVALAVKLFSPACKVIGVEPEGADSISRSLADGEPVVLDQVETMAVSLAAPRAEPLTFGAIRQHVDEMIRLPDAAFPPAMRRMRDALSLTVEPACAAALAALTGPLRDRLAGKRVAIIACGSNISDASWDRLAKLQPSRP